MVDLASFDTKMSDAEGRMWRMEKDPHLSSTFANVTVLDRKPDFERLVRRMEHATWIVPRLRQRVQAAPASHPAPTWVDASNLDLRPLGSLWSPALARGLRVSAFRHSPPPYSPAAFPIPTTTR